MKAVDFKKFKLLEITFNGKLHIFLKDQLLYLKLSISKTGQSQTNQGYMKNKLLETAHKDIQLTVSKGRTKPASQDKHSTPLQQD